MTRTRSTQQKPAEPITPADPPPVPLFTRHGIAVAMAVEVVATMFLSLRDMFDENEREEHWEHKIYQKFMELRDDLWEYSRSQISPLAVHEIGDDEYRRRLRWRSKELPIEYWPIEDLNTIVEMYWRRQRDLNRIGEQMQRATKAA